MNAMDIMEALTDLDDDVLLRAEAEPSVQLSSQKKSFTLRWLPKVAVIAAVVMALTITTFAADAFFYDGKLFGDFFGTDLTDRQTELIDDIGRTFGQSVSSNGSTITPIRGIADEDHYYLHLRVEAPEDVVLPDYPEESGYCYDFNAIERHWGIDSWISIYSKKIDIAYYCCGEPYPMSFQSSVTTLPDEDPTDNVKDFVILFTNCDRLAKFNGGWEKELTIHGLYLLNDEERTSKKLFGGDFTFDIWVNYEDWDETTVELDIEDYTFHTYYKNDYAFTTTVEKIIITPLGLTREFSATKAKHWDICPTGGSVRVVMKDGSSMLVGDYSEYNFGKDEGYLTISELARIEGVNLGYHNENFGGKMGDSYLFPAPIVLEDIDYLIIAGEHVIDMN